MWKWTKIVKNEENAENRKNCEKLIWKISFRQLVFGKYLSRFVHFCKKYIWEMSIRRNYSIHFSTLYNFRRNWSYWPNMENIEVFFLTDIPNVDRICLAGLWSPKKRKEPRDCSEKRLKRLRSLFFIITKNYIKYFM